MVDKRTSEYPRTPLSANTNFSNFVIQNDWPVLQGDWRAEQDPATGKTIYIQNSNNKTLMVNGQKYSGPVNLYGGNITIKSGAVVDGAELIAATNNPSITIMDGGTLSNSNVYNGYVYIKDGGTSENNFYVSEVAKIYSGGKSIHDTFCEPGGTSRTVFKNSAFSGGKVNNVLAGDGTSKVCLDAGGSLQLPSFPNVSAANYCSSQVVLMLAQGSNFNLPDGYVAKNLNNTTYTNDWPYVGKYGGGPAWSAVLDQPSGRTIYKDPNGKTLLGKDRKAYSGPVNILSSLIIKNGATVDGSVMVAAGNNPTVTIKSGGKLTNSDVYNGYLVVESGGVSEKNLYVSQVATIKDGGSSIDDTFVNPKATTKYGSINNSAYGNTKFVTADSTAGFNAGKNATVNNIHIDQSGCGICVTLPGGGSGGCDACYPKVVSAGQTLSNHIIVGSCTLSVYGSAYNTTISGGNLYTYPGSLISGVYADSGIMIASGGTITSVTANSNASTLFTTSNTNVTDLTLNGGQATITDSAKATNVAINSGGKVILTNSATALNTVIDNGGEEYISTGAIDDGATVLTGGTQKVSGTTGTFAHIKNATVSSGGQQIVYDWARTENLTLAGGTVHVSAGGGILGDVNIIAGGEISVYAGAGVSTAISNGAKEVIGVNGAAHDTVITNATQIVQRKGTANNDIVNSKGLVAVRSGGTVNGATINSAGMIKNSAGTINDIIINNGGNAYVYSGGVDTGAIINDGGNQYISGLVATGETTYAKDTTIKTGGQQTITNLGVAENVTLDGGTVNLSAGGAISGDVNFTAGGIVNVYSGATASTAINNGGQEIVYSGGNAMHTTINNGGSIVISQGGVGSLTTINNGGHMVLSKAGIGGNTTINSGGTLTSIEGSAGVNYVQSGGTLSVTGGLIGFTHIYPGGHLYIPEDGSVVQQGNVVLDEGSYLNGILVTEATTTSNIVKDGLFALLHDPTHTNTTPQATSIQTRDFEAPTTFASRLPATDNEGRPIELVDSYEGDAYAQALQMQSYMVDGDFFSVCTTFIPIGGDESDRIWGVGPVTATATPLAPYDASKPDDILIYGNGTPIVGAYDYTTTIYVADTATLKANNSGATYNNVDLSNLAKLEATEGSIANIRVREGGTANLSQNVKVTEAVTVNDGGVINIADPVKLDGATLALESGGKANITTNTGGIISLEGTENKGLVISGSAAQGGTNVASTIQDFDGNDSITLADIQRSDVASVKFVDGSGNPSKDHVTITLNDGSSITLNITDIETTGYSLGENPDGSLTFEVCFLTGTSISTSGSTVCVETIKVGDIVETYDWKTKATVNAAVTWVGHKHMNAKTHLSDDLAGYPVRVLKNAIADNIPNKDLLVTPEHCLFFEGNFVPVSMLVNDRSIYYDRSITSYDYYHIETETHSVIWANGMLTESYLDTGNRNTFVNAQKVVSLFNDTKSWDNDAAAPLNVHREIVEPIYNQINERALEADCVLQTEPLSLTNNPNLCLETELGTIIQPHASKDGKYIFNIPEGVNMVNLLSRTSRPCDTIGSFVDDRRDLGVLVGGVCVVNSNGIYEITNHLSDQDLPGWDVIEQSACRWTNGKATLNIHSNYSEKRILILNILSCGPYIENSFTSKLSKKAS